MTLTPEQFAALHEGALHLPRGPWHVEYGRLDGYPQRICNNSATLLAETYEGAGAPDWRPIPEYLAAVLNHLPAAMEELGQLRARLGDAGAFQPHIADPDARALYERLRLALTCVIADDTEADIREAVARALAGGDLR